MLKDEIIFKNNFENIISCEFCHKPTHLPQICPKFHFIPDKDFLFKKINYSTPQTRTLFRRKPKKSSHALKNNEIIEKNVIDLSTSLYMHYLDQNPEMESNFEFEEAPSPSANRNLSRRRISLSAVNEQHSDSDDEKNEESDNHSEKMIRQMKTTKVLLKSSYSQPFNEVIDSETVN